MTKEENSAKPVPSEVKEVKKQVKAVKKPKTISKPEVKLDKSQIESVIVELYNDGYTQSKIGLVLRDTHNIKSVKKVLGKTILQVLSENKLQSSLPEDLTSLLKKAVSLIKHQKENRFDMTAKRGYQLTVSKIRSLSRYYKSKGVLPKDWVYSEKKAAILVK